MAQKSSVSGIMNDRAQSYKASIEGWRDGRRRASLLFRKVVNGIPVDTPAIEPNSIPSSAALDALRLAKDLTIDICCGNDTVSICAVQDTLFAFVDRIPEDHRIRSLEVTITVVLPNDNNERSMAVSDVWPTSRLKRDIIHENRDLQPGDLSRMHMAAFLTNPLRKIRRIGVGGKKELVQLELQGRTGPVWKEMFDGVEKMMRGETEVKDYEVFRRYFEDIRHVIKGISGAVKNIDRLCGRPVPGKVASTSPKPPETPPPTPATLAVPEVIDLTGEVHDVIDLAADDSEAALGLADLRGITKTLAMARIRASFKDLRVAHKSLLEMADNVLKTSPPFPEDQHLVEVIESLRQNREYAAESFPKKADVSYYGYNESDGRLTSYRSDLKAHVPQGGSQIKRKRKHTD